MFQASHLIAKNVPGCGVVEGSCLPCSGVSGRATTVSSSSRADYRFHSQVKIGSQKDASKGAALVCKASSSGHRRNPDFSRQNRHGFSRNRHRQNEERESFDNLNESDALSPKNGPLLSLSNTPKFHATAAPGPREKEIVELFRKVQAQLRERAASKVEKKIETSKVQGKESDTVDSLLKLLRKHSVEQSKRNSRSNGSNKDLMLDQQVQNDSYNGRKSRIYYNSNNILKDENRIENGLKPEQELEQALEAEPETEPDLELEPESKPKATFLDSGLANLSEGESSDADEPFNDENGVLQPKNVHGDLSALKLPELRALAKSLGLRGYSKMKKSELVELLSGSLV
ncbi:hypothetical protein I3842_03G254500 [Carya illinoinensis]|uniref:Rho termination factor-like N-terminal domain-containing protein n=1 Tax=Carya illinoinensis TaxID=32201 RepID=A0A922JX74_CARIL|nr:hypothetical protein I3842_03G254500 [Carya illinoinensis]